MCVCVCKSKALEKFTNNSVESLTLIAQECCELY